MEKLRDKNGVGERELRSTISEVEKARSEAASLQLEVERFAARMGKYQDAEERMNEECHRYRIESEKYKERLDKSVGEIEFLKNAREKAEDEIARLRSDLSNLESYKKSMSLGKKEHHSCLKKMGPVHVKKKGASTGSSFTLKVVQFHEIFVKRNYFLLSNIKNFVKSEF